jgi:hypothetical protein
MKLSIVGCSIAALALTMSAGTLVSAQAHGGSVAGTWKVAIDFEQQHATAGLELKVDGRKVTGTLVTAFAGGSVPLEGEFADGKLTFSISTTGGPHPGIQVDFYGTLTQDGTLEGKLSGIAEGETPWTAQRIH